LFSGGDILRIENETQSRSNGHPGSLDDGYRNTAFESASVGMLGIIRLDESSSALKAHAILIPSEK
jgi:hypothetical protein